MRKKPVECERLIDLEELHEMLQICKTFAAFRTRFYQGKIKVAPISQDAIGKRAVRFKLSEVFDTYPHLKKNDNN